MTQTQHVQPVLAGALLLPLPRCILSDFSQRNATILHLHAFTPRQLKGSVSGREYAFPVVDYVMTMERFIVLN